MVLIGSSPGSWVSDTSRTAFSAAVSSSYRGPSQRRRTVNDSQP
jgi:hypothetical protein